MLFFSAGFQPTGDFPLVKKNTNKQLLRQCQSNPSGSYSMVSSPGVLCFESGPNSRGGKGTVGTGIGTVGSAGQKGDI